MAIEVPKDRGTLGLERDRFGLNSNNRVVVRVEDEDGLGLLQAILTALGGSTNTQATQTSQATIANTQVAIVLPADTVEFRVQARGESKMKLSFSPGGIAAGDYLTVWPGNCEVVQQFFQSQTIYVETSKDDVLEVTSFANV